jgi:cytidylate kinase
MRPQHSARALAESIVHANSYRESHAQARLSEESPALTIAISRQVGAGGTSIAAAVGERLGWPVYDNALVEQIAREMRLRTKLVESVDERRTSWLTDSALSFSQMPLISASAYLRHLIQTVLSLGAHGSCVIVGRGATHILPPSTTLRVRLVAGREDRITVLARELGVPRAEAEAGLDKLEHERVAFVKDHFRKDPCDPLHFDLVLNSSSFSYSECADLIVDALHRVQNRTHHGVATG